MSTVSDIGLQRAVRQLAGLAREIAGAALTAELAADRADFDVLDDSLTSLTELHERLRAQYRALLVAGIRAVG